MIAENKQTMVMKLSGEESLEASVDAVNGTIVISFRDSNSLALLCGEN
jgi:hypothetical protein